MAELLLINPRRRVKAKTRKNPAKRRARRHNPIARAAHAPARAHLARRRRRNPIGLGRVHHHAKRRRRNPIGGLNTNAIMGMLKDAAIGGAGAVAMDVLMGQINTYLPASLQTTTSVGIGDAVKMGVTIAAGELLDKSTKGLSKKMAIGALSVQFADIIKSFLPASMTLGYASPANIIRGSQRVGPNMARPGIARPGHVAAYQMPGTKTPLLHAYQRPGATPLLSGARQREGFMTR